MAVAKAKKPLKKFDKLDDDAPVLPSLASTMDVELVVGSEGKTLVVISEDVPEAYWWAEYDVDLEQLYFVTVNGKIQGLGIKIHEPLEERMTESTDLRIVKYDKKTESFCSAPYVVSLVVRKHTLEDPYYG